MLLLHPSGTPAQALDYHALGLNVVPIWETSKTPALRTFDWWQYDQQEAGDLPRVIYRPALDLAVLGGVASGNAFFVDCETEECFAAFACAVAATAGQHATVKTRRGGHLWLRAPFPVQPHSYGDFEIKGQGNYVLAPPSRHPSGAVYSFTTGCRAIPAVASLPFVTLEPKFVPRVSRFAHDLFRGREVREYRSRSERDQAFILSLARSGFELSTIEKALSIAQFPSKYRELARDDEKSARQYLEHSHARALAYPDAQDARDAREVIARWEHWALSERWTGRTGAVDRAVFLGHLYCAHYAGSLVYNASVRQIAELAQTTAPTVSRANRRLIDLGVVRLHRRYVGMDAYAYRLLPDAPETQNAQVQHSVMKKGSYPIMSRCCASASDAFAGVWEYKGLGKTALLLWESLAESRKDYKAIAEGSGRGLRTVAKWLPVLIQRGLVVRDDMGYRQAQHIDWAELAHFLMAENLQAERMLKHQRERERFGERQRIG